MSPETRHTCGEHMRRMHAIKGGYPFVPKPFNADSIDSHKTFNDNSSYKIPGPLFDEDDDPIEIGDIGFRP